MTVARSELVDVAVTPWYHVISKTVRGAFLLREGAHDRKQWIEDRLGFLAGVFSIDVAGFAVLDNHMHVLVRLAPERTQDWTGEDVVRRWARLFPPRAADRQPVKVTDEWVARKAADEKFVLKARARLADLGWFMKCLKEPLARLANKADSQTGAFWQSRYKSIAILDEEALLATCAYIDLNPVAAGIASLPEESEHTSVKVRVDHCREQDRMPDLQASRAGSVDGVKVVVGLEDDLWLCPIEDARRTGDRAGMLESFGLGSYLQLLDYTSRLVRRGKARISPGVQSMLDRLGTSKEVWASTVLKMFRRSMPVGIAFAFKREKLRAAAAHRGCHHVDNLNGCPA